MQQPFFISTSHYTFNEGKFCMNWWSVYISRWPFFVKDKNLYELANFL